MYPGRGKLTANGIGRVLFRKTWFSGPESQLAEGQSGMRTSPATACRQPMTAGSVTYRSAGRAYLMVPGNVHERLRRPFDVSNAY